MIGSKDGYALVTGASSGMGHAYAKLFARDGKNIVAPRSLAIRINSALSRPA